MAKKKKKSFTRRLITYCVATALFGSGAGGLTFPDLPVIGPAVQGVVNNLLGSPKVEAARQEIREVVKDQVVNKDPRVSEVVGKIHQVAQQVAKATSATPTPGTTPTTSSPTTSSPPPPNLAPVGAPRPGSVVSIAAFNIQVFGTAKLNEAWVANILADIVRRFDVTAIQELRSQDDTVIPRFVQMINNGGYRFHYAVGPRLGRTNSKEQYVFIYNTDRLELDPRSVLTIGDPEGNLHRPPLVGHFRVRGLPAGQGFSFWLLNVHTDPDDVRHEIDVLADVFAAAQRDGWGEDDVILLGDFNAAPAKFGALARIPGFATVVSTQPTNTRGNQTYDNICFAMPATSEYTGDYGVVNLMKAYGLTMDQALKVSDHYPVWASFSSYEASGAGPLARQPR